MNYLTILFRKTYGIRLIKNLLLIIAGSFVILTILTTTIFILINVEAHPYIAQDLKDVGTAQTAIVLGARVSADGVLSPIFKDRIDVAIQLYKDKKVKTILITGDNSSLSYNEVNPAREYLLSQGIPSDVIFLDHAGFDTYSSMYRAKEIFLVTSAIIVTQSFHLPRAVFIANRLGLNAHGAIADQHPYLFKNSVREIFADVKAFFNVMYYRMPKYLGEEIPITGSGVPSI